MAQSRNPLFDTATVLGKIVAFLGVSAVCGVLLAGLLVPAAAVTGTSASGSIKFFDSLPTELTVEPPGTASKVLASDGSLIATMYQENRTPVPLAQMSPFIKDAIVSVEDSRYYEHGGIDPTGIARALVSTVQGGRQGASTITQQYVNNVINESLIAEGKDNQVVVNGNDKKIGTKLREMKLAIALEKHMSKDQILEGYLNIVFFNTNAYGIEAASKYFFSVSSKDLTLPQAALLAGLVNSPSAYNPLTHPEASKMRRDLVLDAMLKNKKITQKQHDDAVKTPVTTKVTQPRQGCAYAVQAPYFCDYVENLIMNNPAYGETPADRSKLLTRGGLTITTTLDSQAQKAAQGQVNAAASPNQNLWASTLVSIKPGDGAIVSMAQNTQRFGPATSFVTDYNLNVDKVDANGNSLGGSGGMDPGSTMKPVTFAAWLNEGKSMNTYVDGTVRRYAPGFPWKTTCAPVEGFYDSTAEGSTDLQNAEGGYYTKNTVLYGLANSLNTFTFASAAQLNDFCDIQRIADALHMHDGGTTNNDEKVLKTAPLKMNVLGSLLGSNNLSPLTMASAFATFDADGTYCAPYAITSIKDNSGKALPVQTKNCQAEAIKPDVAKGVTYALQQVVTQGSGIYMPKVGFPVAAKTGTNNNNNQVWVVGYSKGLVTASFFGVALGSPSSPELEGVGRNVTINGKYFPALDGATAAGPQWAGYMNEIGNKFDTGAFPEPPAELTNVPYVAPPATQNPNPGNTSKPGNGSNDKPATGGNDKPGTGGGNTGGDTGKKDK